MAYVSLLWTSAVIVVYIAVLAADDGWHHKWTFYYQIDVGLFSVRLQKGMLAHVGTAALAKVNSELEGHLSNLLERTFTVQEFMEYMCQLKWPGFSACGAGTMLKFASEGLICCLLLSLMMHCLALGFQYYYTFRDARQVTRHWLWTFQICGPTFAAVGLVGYAFGTVDLDRLPPAGGESGGTAGMQFTMATWVTVMSIAPLIVTTVTGKTTDEVRAEGIATLRKFGLGSDNLYGSNDHGNVPLAQSELGSVQQQASSHHGSSMQHTHQQYFSATPDMYSGAQQYMAQPQQQFGSTEYGAQQAGYVPQYQTASESTFRPSHHGDLQPQGPLHGAAF